MSPESKLAVVEAALKTYEISISHAEEISLAEDMTTEKKLEIAQVAIKTIQTVVDIPS